MARYDAPASYTCPVRESSNTLTNARKSGGCCLSGAADQAIYVNCAEQCCPWSRVCTSLCYFADRAAGRAAPELDV